jgi:hypothetical protein
MSRLTRSIALSVIGLAIAAGPGATGAAAGVIDYGAIANCRYKVTQGGTFGWTEALLKRIVVRPPTLPPMSTMASVGWRFQVLRSLDRGNTPYVVTYKSPIQRAATSAGFTPMRVNVKVPTDVEDPSHVWYRVRLRMLWYKADGSLFTSSWYTMNDLHLIVAGEELIDTNCPGLAQQWFD